MNRRGFLGLVSAIAAGAMLDPERLLWVPGRKLISIPRPIPPMHRVGVGFELSTPMLPLEEIELRYLEPAVAALEAAIQERYRVSAFEALRLPPARAVDLAAARRSRLGMPLRVLIGCDVRHPDGPRYVVRVDCAFRGERKRPVHQSDNLTYEL